MYNKIKRGDILIYTVTLNPALDYVLKVNKLSFNDINRADETELFFGGKGINVSAVLNELECDNIALGFVGGFSGNKLEKMLEKANIKTDFVHINDETRINVKIRYGNELDINAEGPEISEEDIEELMKKLERIEEGDFLVLAGSVPKNLPSDIYERIMQKLSNGGINFVVDAEGELLLNSLKYKPFLIKPNHHELGALFKASANKDEVINNARKLKEAGAKNVLVSLAENGAVLLDETNTVHNIKNAKGELVNSVGCGDSMIAGFIAGYIKTGDYSYALKLGTACGNATAYSDKLAGINEINELIQKL